MSDTVNALSTYSSSLASVIVGSTVDAAGVQFVKNQENWRRDAELSPRNLDETMTTTCFVHLVLFWLVMTSSTYVYSHGFSLLPDRVEISSRIRLDRDESCNVSFPWISKSGCWLTISTTSSRSIWSTFEAAWRDLTTRMGLLRRSGGFWQTTRITALYGAPVFLIMYSHLQLGMKDRPI